MGKRARRIGVLTGGGDAPGLNSVLEGLVSRAVREHRFEVVGSEDGFEGLIQPPSRKKVVPLTLDRVKGIAPRGGSILGCSNTANPWAYPVTRRGKKEFIDVSHKVLKHLGRYELDAVVLIGGDGTMAQAKRLADMGVRVIGVPKTIDNDLAATDYTFGFNTALYTATWALDRLHTTAHAHDRVIICEVMGRYAGWIALEAGIASGAHCILIPEIEYDVQRIIRKINSLGGRYSSYAVIVCSEGAREKGGSYCTEGDVIRTKDGKIAHLPKLSGAAEKLASELKGRIVHDIRVTVLGHVQRGGSPTPFDRILGLRFGVAAADLLARHGFGRMVALRTPRIVDVPFEDVIGKPKLVDPGGELVRTARSLGVEMGA
jgi:phosphofructokinase-like protein